jgi:transcriptional regulator with XRE-family HTH domain
MHALAMRTWDWDEDVNASVLAGAAIIGCWVRAARLSQNLTQRQLAWRCGLAQSTISRLETGRLPGMRLRTLAGIVGVLSARPEPSYGEPAPATRRLPGQHPDIPNVTSTDDRQTHECRAHAQEDCPAIAA